MMKDCGNCTYAHICRQQTCSAGRPTPWFETPEEIAAGLAWGARKTYLMRWVKRHMGETLSRRQQQVVELYLFRGMTFKQIAKVAGVDRSTVSRSVKRSVVRLHRLWRAEQAAVSGPAGGGRNKQRGGKSRRPA